MRSASELDDSKWRQRTRLELYAHRNDGSVEYVCDDDGYWRATATIPHNPGRWIVTSGPKSSVEEACAEVIRRFGLAGLEPE